MRLCRFYNHTIISVDTKIREIISIEKNCVVGALGSCLDGILERPKHRTCRIIGHNELGQKFANGSYSHIFGLLQSRKADLLLKGESQNLDEPTWLGKTLPMRTSTIVIGHRIFDKKDVHYFDLIHNFNMDIEIFSIYFCSLLISAFIYLILLKFNDKIKNRSKFLILINFMILSVKKYKLSSIGIFILIFNLYIMFTQFILLNTIKTNKIVVDTSDIIKNSYDVLKTKRINCYLNEESELQISINSPKGSILDVIYTEKSKFNENMKSESAIVKNERCIMQKTWEMVKLIETPKIWLSNEPIHEFNTVFYYRLKNEANNRFIEQTVAQYVEFGIIEKCYACMQTNTKFRIQKEIDLYNSIKDFVNRNSIFSSLSLSNFRTILLIYFINGLVILLVFGLNLILKRSDFFRQLQFACKKKFKANFLTENAI